jgi:hypothetical protein
MDQQQVLKEYRKHADQGIVLRLNSNAEVSHSASVCLLPLLIHEKCKGYC